MSQALVERVLAASGRGKNKETPVEIGCICWKQSSYWTAVARPSKRNGSNSVYRIMRSKKLRMLGGSSNADPPFLFSGTMNRAFFQHSS